MSKLTNNEKKEHEMKKSLKFINLVSTRYLMTKYKIKNLKYDNVLIIRV